MYREATAYRQSTYEMSERPACRVIGADKTSVRYQATRPDDSTLQERLKVLIQKHLVATTMARIGNKS